ncbi:MAG TPA: arylesterase [Gemmatimonadaceae bacterium]
MNRGKREAGRGKRALAVGLLTTVVLACSKGPDKVSDSAATTPTAESTDSARSPASRFPLAASRKTVLFAGTSLTAGLGLEPDSAYPMLIQRSIDSAGLPFEVVNAGVSGETSSGLLDRLDWLLRGNFAVMVIETGANDGLRGIPASTLRGNLEAVLDRIKAKRPDARVVLVQMEALPNLGPKYTTDFHRLYAEVAKEKGVPLLPFLLQGVAGRRDLNQADGIHPNYTGERIVAQNVWKGLKPILDSLDRGDNSR